MISELIQFLKEMTFWQWIGITIWLMILLELHKRFWSKVREAWKEISDNYEKKLKLKEMEKKNGTR